MSLRHQLERLRRLGLAPATGRPPGAGAAAGSVPQVDDVCARLGLERRAGPWGWITVREQYLPAAEPWGRVAPAELAGTPLEPLLRFGRLEAAVAGADDIVFLDTETTGLSGGTGTLVVVAGLARLIGDRLRIRQFVLLDPASEVAFLEALAGELHGARLLVTFNGRAFDWPLLETRFVLQRSPTALPSVPHLDLLHPSRRLYGSELPSCRLSELESRVLGADRGFDIPGHEVPVRYRLMLEGRPEPFAAVLDHNRCDLQALAALTTHVAALSHHGLTAGRSAPPAGPRQWLALAESCLDAGDHGRAEFLLRRVLDAADQPGGKESGSGPWFAAARTLATLYRRQGRWDEARALWRQIPSHHPAGAVWALVESAKEREHRARDLEGALADTEQALVYCRRWLQLGSRRARREIAELEHRRRRLLRRLGRLPEGLTPRTGS